MRSRTPLIALVGVAALALTSCAAGTGSGGGGDPTEGTLADGKTFTSVISTDPGNLDPFVTVMSVARSIDRFLYARLVEVMEDGSIASGLADSWEADTTTATFTLRDGLTCEDGTPLTATDVAANITHIGDPDNGSPLIGLQVQPGTSAVGDDANGTVTVTSGRPDSFLLENIGSISIVCGSVIDDPDALAKGEGSTGMFTMTKIAPNSEYTLTRRDDFAWGPDDWDPKQKGLPDTVVFRVIPNETTAANLLLSGEVNAALVIGPDRTRLSDAGLFSTEMLVPAGQFTFNQATGRPTADQAVREALLKALDLEQMRQVLGGGTATVPTGMVTVSPNPCRADVLKGYIPSFDAKAAAAELDKAGWKVGSDGTRSKDGEPLTLKMIYSSSLGDAGNATAELAQTSWKSLGVDVTVVSVDSPTLSETLFSTGDWDISAASLTVSLPSMLVPFFSGPTPPDGTNFASIVNQDYVDAVTAASAKASSEGCDDWGKAEQALYATSSVMQYANLNQSTFANKATFTSGDGIDPTSIRMYE
ncbi:MULTISPECIES: ABC transporter substrate-binding protein [unclassified Microbacterium]|uniref:ABC transporter substrate-binding protein n=1 Tax=unclassified Microbacterium TaxID=2609290 RepID=UPI003019D472